MNLPRLVVPWWCAGAWVLVLMSSAGSFALMGGRTRGASDGGKIPSVDRAAEVSNGAMPPRAGRWSEPVGAGQGELFTDPALVYDEVSDRFVPPSAPEDAVSEPEIHLELLEVHSGELPLRLIGHVGFDDSLRGIFVDATSGETLVAGAGQVFSGLGHSVASLHLHRSLEDGRHEVVAVIQDATSGERVELRAGQPPQSGLARARVRVVATGRILELGEGTSVDIGGWTYRVSRLQADDAKVELLPEEAGAPAVAWVGARIGGELGREQPEAL